MVRRSGEAGVALIFALVALAVVAFMIAIVGASIQPRVTSHQHHERTVRLTALVDAAMATSLAELALDRGFAGVTETPLGEGAMSSAITQTGLHEVEVVAVGRVRSWRAIVVARVDLEYGPRVVRWHRFLAAE